MNESLVEAIGDDVQATPSTESQETSTTESASLTDKVEKDTETSETKAKGKFAGKYETPEELEKGYKEQTKAVKDLTKQLKERETKETISDDFDLAEALKEVQGLPEGAAIDKDDVIFQAMMPAMKDAGLTPDQAKHLAGEFVKMQLGEIPDSEQEIAALGDNAKETLSKIGKVIQSLPEDQATILKSMTTTADEVKTLLSFAEKFSSGEKGIPTGSNQQPLKSATELEAEAFAYKNQYAKSIGSNRGQQEHYNHLMKQAQAAKEYEKNND